MSYSVFAYLVMFSVFGPARVAGSVAEVSPEEPAQGQVNSGAVLARIERGALTLKCGMLAAILLKYRFTLLKLVGKLASRNRGSLRGVASVCQEGPGAVRLCGEARP